VWRRLTAEGRSNELAVPISLTVLAGFIEEQRDPSGHASGKKVRKGHNGAKSKKWIFVAGSARSAVFREYFDPLPTIEFNNMRLGLEVRSHLVTFLLLTSFQVKKLLLEGSRLGYARLFFALPYPLRKSTWTHLMSLCSLVDVLSLTAKFLLRSRPH
jgi:hypothetical protein